MFNTMLEQFKPNETVDRQIYDRVVGLHKAQIIEAAMSLNSNSTTVKNEDLNQKVIELSSDVRTMVKSFYVKKTDPKWSDQLLIDRD